MIKLTAKDGGVILAVRVQPRSSRSGITGESDGVLKVRLAAPPVDGEANDELVRLLAKHFDVSRQQVEIVSGQTAKNKLVRISGVTESLCREILEKTLK